MEMKKYVYVGPVESFGRCICSKWIAETFAPTAARAKTNLTYRFKKLNGLSASTKVNLAGVIKAAD